jgi:hypothetical protein
VPSRFPALRKNVCLWRRESFAWNYHEAWYALRRAASLNPHLLRLPRDLRSEFARSNILRERSTPAPRRYSRARRRQACTSWNRYLGCSRTMEADRRNACSSWFRLSFCFCCAGEVGGGRRAGRSLAPVQLALAVQYGRRLFQNEWINPICLPRCPFDPCLVFRLQVNNVFCVCALNAALSAHFIIQPI